MNRNPITLTAGLMAATVVGVAQIPFSSLVSGLYTQNFDSLANSGTGLTWTDNLTLSGWYLSRAIYDAGTGGSSTGAAYSFGTAAAPTDRALGSVASTSTGQIAYGVRFRNDMAGSFTSVDIGYVGEEWRKANNSTAQRLQFSYKISATPITSVLETGFSSVTQLDFVSPVASATTAAALNGNLPANQNSLALNLILSQSLDPGEEIMFRWIDVDDANADHGLAIDNLSIEVPEASAFLPVCATGVAGVIWMMRRRVR